MRLASLDAFLNQLRAMPWPPLMRDRCPRSTVPRNVPQKTNQKTDYSSFDRNDIGGGKESETQNLIWHCGAIRGLAIRDKMQGFGPRRAPGIGH